MLENIAVVCNSYGLELFNYVPQEKVKCLIVASNRPQYFEELKLVANKLGIAFLIQPLFNSDEYQNFYLQIKKLNIDLLLCYSYSMLIREDILKLVNYNAINLHTALLPKNQGPNPTQWALIQGETTTGTTLHYMDNTFDTGDIIAQKKLDIEINDTWVSVNKKLHEASIELIKENFQAILKGTNKRHKQDKNIATKTQKLTPSYPKINFQQMNLWQIYNLIRAQVSPLSGAYYIDKNKQTIYIKKRISFFKVWKLIEKNSKEQYVSQTFYLSGMKKKDLKNFYKNQEEKEFSYKSFKQQIKQDIENNNLFILCIRNKINNKIIAWIKITSFNFIQKNYKIDFKLFNEKFQKKKYLKEIKSLIKKFMIQEFNMKKSLNGKL